MSQIQTKYITPDEFRDYFGIDLALELPDDTNPSNKAMAFLKRIEDRVETIKSYGTTYGYWKNTKTGENCGQIVYVYEGDDDCYELVVDKKEGEQGGQ